MLIGMTIGWFVGILPGLGGSVTLALMLPFIYTMSPVEAIAFLLGMHSVAATTGDITSVLFGVPGEGAAAATIVDGHPMARKGEAGRALGAALGSSLVGAIIGGLALAALIPVLRPVVLAFGAPEYFMFILAGITFITAVGGRSLVKGFAAAALGFLVSMIGVDPHYGAYRYTFDWLYLWDGVNIITVAIGLFAVPAIIDMAVGGTAIAGEVSGKITGAMEGLKDTFRHWGLTVRCSLLGTLVGIIPGIGGGTAQWVAYGHAVQSSPNRERFGHGAVEGVLGPGAANNSKEGGSLVPTIAFGVPGSLAMAILLGAFLILGMVPGPDMLSKYLDVTFSMVWTIVVANIIIVGVSFLFLNQVAKITLIKGARLIPFLLVLIFIGGFAANNLMGDLWLILGFGALGWIMVKLDWPRPPMILGVILGGLAENYLWLSIEAWGATWLTRPVVLVLFVIVIAATVWPFWQRRRDKDTKKSSAPTGSKSGILFTIFMALVFAWAVFDAKQWVLGARLFPWVIGTPAFLLVMVHLAREWRGWRVGRSLVAEKGPTFWSTEARRTASIGAWTVGFFVAIWLLGFTIATPLLVFLYLKVVSRENWLFSLIFAGVGWAFVYGLFIRVLHFPFPVPQLFFWLGIW
jgi:TctA family transporter